ncbi:egl nine homolog 1-like [Uloborus diversus]|uniref:egl nine homolog 1-like n=1 Tax=Uloborus diversus TaxID=327109 RepID=UPI0024090844|nr:egl nine homolog 1-like [Uloborus diversus]
MDLSNKNSLPQKNFCEFCSNIGTSRCGRCHSVCYCSRQHQLLHWPIHKKNCKTLSTNVSQVPTVSNPPCSSEAMIDNYQQYGNWCQNNTSRERIQNLRSVTTPPNEFSLPSSSVSQEKPIEYSMPNEDEIFSSLNSEFLSSDNNFWDVINTCNAQSLFDSHLYLEKDETIDKLPGSNSQATQSCSQIQNNPSDSGKIEYSMQCVPLNDICTNIVHDLNKYGICVLDKFIGNKSGSMILEEVKNLYMRGIFQKGEIVNPYPYTSKESVRNDVTTWVNGTEPGCRAIGNLIRKLDVVVTTCNKMEKNGILSRYKLHRRTKAMVACYPGDGTYYKKHIDNPHEDGRCITCIYYLNKNWNTKEHGGLLRMFPPAHSSVTADIEPIFDRMLFFWSDKRNPHEVLPSYSTRFAITVWYFDADERDRALKKSKKQQFM